ncbi:MAG: acetyl-CoA C-acyltransferase [Gammaproteobacteria bacterium]|jgi:acetyl-CoA acyltransferase|nr:acetyl-CoA C-acyltransferase [Xanthomonadales bacterium]
MIFKQAKVAFIDGVRTPFAKSPGVYGKLRSYDLGREALLALKQRNPILQDQCEQVTMGCVIHNSATSNVARESLIGAGYDLSTPAFTVTQACISANRAITNTVEAIQAGTLKTAVAGGVESTSDAPVRISDNFKAVLLKAQRAKGFGDYWRLFRQFKFKDLIPVAPAIAEFSTGQTMGQDADRLAARFGVTREEQDEFALRSHQLAAKAWEEGKFKDEVQAVMPAPAFEPLEQDNTFYADSSMEKLSKLRPVFVKPNGTVTAGNASPLTDGASACLLMDIEEAKKQGYNPNLVIYGYQYSAHNPDGELLLGPAFTIPKLLNEAGLKIDDVDVYEIHEAFAGQVLANLKALQDKEFCVNRLGLNDAFGEIPMDRINTQGGSLSLGHPFGATGGRLLISAARRLNESDGEYALISACAAGGQGSSILLRKLNATAKPKTTKKVAKKTAKKVSKKVVKKTTKKTVNKENS